MSSSAAAARQNLLNRENPSTKVGGLFFCPKSTINFTKRVDTTSHIVYILNITKREIYKKEVPMNEQLIKLRGERSQEEVAKALGISVSALSMYEQGNRIPRDEIKVKMAEYYGISIEYLFLILFPTKREESEAKV